MFRFRQATSKDIPDIVALLADDILGQQREAPNLQAYEVAFEKMQNQQGNYITLMLDKNSICGCYQMTIIHGLSRAGASRAHIEGVRIHQHYRGQGLGEKLFQHAIDEAKASNCQLVQLTSDLNRPDAIRFYEKLGFEHSHAGFKLNL